MPGSKGKMKIDCPSDLNLKKVLRIQPRLEGFHTCIGSIKKHSKIDNTVLIGYSDWPPSRGLRSL